VGPIIIAAMAALVIFAGFLVLDRVRAGGPSVEGRLEQFGGRNRPEAVEAPREKQKLTARADKALGRGKWAQTTARKLAQADLKLTVTEFLLIKIFVVAIGFMFGQFLGRGAGALSILTALIFAGVGYFIPDWYVKFRQGKRMNAFNDQLGDTITLLANSLRSGYSFLQSMEMVARESPPPMGIEFRRVIREVGLGLSTQDALNNLVKRMPSEDLDLMITAVNIQQEVGGNLAVILDTIGHTIRERVRIKGEIRTLTAMGRISGYIISGLPLFLGIVITLINPKYMASMFNLPWLCMPICGGIMVVIGFLVIQKIVTIDV
jgi:tight adherence protein B